MIRGCLKSCRQPLQNLDRYIPFGPFDLRYVGAVKFGFEGQSLLGQAGRLTERPHIFGQYSDDSRALSHSNMGLFGGLMVYGL